MVVINTFLVHVQASVEIFTGPIKIYLSYSATRLTVATQQTFLQVSSRNIIICLTDMPPCKVEHHKMETCHIVFINKSYDITRGHLYWVATVRGVSHCTNVKNFLKKLQIILIGVF